MHVRIRYQLNMDVHWLHAQLLSIDDGAEVSHSFVQLAVQIFHNCAANKQTLTSVSITQALVHSLLHCLSLAAKASDG